MRNILNLAWMRVLAKDFIAGMAVSLPMTIFISMGAFWDDLVGKYVSRNVLPAGLRADQIEYIAFSYIDQSLFDTILTMLFWVVVSVLGIFMLWLLSSTYTTISNVLLVDTAYKNKPQRFLILASEHILQRVAVSVVAMFGIIFIFKQILPEILSKIGGNLLVSRLAPSNYVLIVFWVVMFTLTLTAIRLIIKYAVRYLKSPLVD